MKILNGGSLISKSSATFGKPNGDGSRWSHSDGEFKLHHKASLRLANRGALDLGGQPLHLADKHSQIIIGGGPDDEAQAGGTLTAGQLVFSSDASKAGTQKLVFNHIPTEAGLDFSPALSGKGQIEHKQGHTILSGHSEQFAGSTAQAELGADLAVNRQATLVLGYAGEFASRSQQHTVSLNARWAF